MSNSIDHSALEMLRTLQNEGEPDFTLKMIGIFLEALPTRLTLIRKAGESGNLKLLHSEAHTLKSSCGTLGARKLAAICVQLEDITKPGTDLTGLAELLRRLDAEAVLVRDELTRLGSD